ncbi:MAG: MFS transporter, partial [Pseudomonadota bacterium]
MNTQPTDNKQDGAEPGLFGFYLGGQATWFSSVGLQMVLFAWLVTDVLDERAFRVGLAQTALMAPSLLFMIFGGAFADRSDTRAVLIRLHCAAAIPPLALALIIFSGELRYEWLIVYGLIMGSLSAFAIPARDSLLSTIAVRAFGDDIQRAVTMASGVQFLGQLGGIIVAGAAAVTGAPALLALQSVVMFSGAL